MFDRMKSMKQVLFLGSLAIGYNRQIVRALGEHAEARGDLRILFPTEFDKLEGCDLQKIKIHGVILGSNPPGYNWPVTSKRRLPTIDVSAEEAPRNLPRVATDDFQVGRMAAEYFMLKGFRNLAYYGMAGRHWSEARWRGFDETAKKAGLKPHRFTRTTPRGPYSLAIFPLSVGDWVKSLPPASAIFGGDDLLGAEIIASCRASGLQVPGDAAILSVDNDDIFGLWNGAQLSTIRLNTKMIAQRALELLAELMTHPRRAVGSELIAPVEVVTRLSTNIFGVDDPVVRRALELAQQHIGDGVSVKWLAAKLGVSRATLERCFLSGLGRSPARELARMQAHMARRILINSRHSVERIAEQIGYTSAKQLRASLREVFGQTPSEIRAANLTTG
jgi:LacI family transcriptional regulator